MNSQGDVQFVPGSDGKFLHDQPYELATHTFVVEIWREGRSKCDGAIRWRGRVKHMPSGAQHVFEGGGARCAGELNGFIAPMLKAAAD